MLAGIDLGGTQVRVALARSDGRLLETIKTKTALLPTAQAMVDWAAAEIDRHRGREKVRSITIAAPGPIDLKRGVLVNPPNLPWPNAPPAPGSGSPTMRTWRASVSSTTARAAARGTWSTSPGRLGSAAA